MAFFTAAAFLLAWFGFKLHFPMSFENSAHTVNIRTLLLSIHFPKYKTLLQTLILGGVCLTH